MTLPIETQLEHIARQVVQKYANHRVEYDDMLQEARLAAWQSEQRGRKNGLLGAELRRYVLGAARNECERVVAAMQSDLLFHCDNYGLFENLPDNAVPTEF